MMTPEQAHHTLLAAYHGKYGPDAPMPEMAGWMLEAVMAASDSLKTELELARRVQTNFEGANNAANEQAERLYATVKDLLSPTQRAVFEAAMGRAQPCVAPLPGALSFGDALNMLWAGERVCRAGWNGKGMWLLLIQQSAVQAELPPGTRLLPWIGMKTADGGFVPWLTSQTDALAHDWQVVE